MTFRMTFLVVAALGCGPAGNVPQQPSSSCGQQNGLTDCRGITCQAGNYCTNNFMVSEYCKPGCTSDANCGSTEFCGKCSGEAVGTCIRCGQTPTCGMGSQCKADNFASSRCTSEGKGSQGFACSNGDQPVGQCTQSSVDPTFFCCGANTGTCTAKSSSNQCDNAFVMFMGTPGQYSKPYSCAGSATPAGTCKHLNADIWCCN